MAGSININQNNNDITIQDQNGKITITNNSTGITTNVTQPVTSVVTVASLGPQGPAGPAGAIPSTGSFVTTSSFNAFTGSYNTGSFTGSFTGTLNGTASYALTASYLQGSVSPFPFSGSAVITGSLTISGSSTLTNIGPAIFSGSLIVTQGITGSLSGNATTATTASYALTASYVANASSFPFTGSALITGSLGVTGSVSLRAYTASADVVFNVRNTSNTYDIISSYGNELTIIGRNESTEPRLLINRAGSTKMILGGTTDLNITFPSTGKGEINGGAQGLDLIATSGDIRTRNSSTSTILKGNFFGVGQATPAARLDVLAQGALSTDIAFRVRNSADTANLIEQRGNGSLLFSNSTSTYVLNPRTDADGFSLSSGNGLYGTGTGMEVVSNQFLINNSSVRTFRFSGATVSNVWYLHNESGQLRICPTTDTTDPIINLNGTTRFVGIGILTPTARLDVKASGSTSSDLAFRVRNSANTADLISFRGDGSQWIQSVPFIHAGNLTGGTNAAQSLYVGYNSSVTSSIGTRNTIIGTGAGNSTNGNEQTAIGWGVSTGGYNTSIAIGAGATLTANNQCVIGSETYPFNTLQIGTGGIVTSAAAVQNMILSVGGVAGGYTSNTDLSSKFFRIQSQGGSGTGNSAPIQFSVAPSGTAGFTANNFVIPLEIRGDAAGLNHYQLATPRVPSASITDGYIQYSNDIAAGNAAPHFRTENGSIIKLYQQSAVTSSQGLADALTNLGFLTGSSSIPGVSFGQFGIANTSGSYTYYTTFSSSIAAATSGQTVEMFADVTETGSVTITLKNGVNINGNGHTYTLNNSGLTHALTVPVTVETTCNVLNLNVIRTGSTGTLFDNSCLILGTSGTGIINCAGSTFRNLGSGVGILFSTNSTHEINYAVAYATTTWAAIAMFTSAGAKLNNSIGYGTSGGYGIRCHNGGDTQNCTGVSDSGYGIFGLAGNQSNSVGISASGNGFFSQGSCYGCVGRSLSGVGFDIGGGINTINCIGISVSGVGMSINLADIWNCTGISSSSRGMQIVSNGSRVYNATSKSTSSYSILSNNSSVQIYNSIIISDWNNAGGIGISSNNTTIPGIILNTTFLLSNASAPYLFNNTAAQAVSTRGNTYKGGGAYSVLITQAIVATEDAQGNIYL
jgi:hypothetical protein